MADETTPVAPAPVKPGYQTTEFWLSAAAVIIGLLLASGVIQSGGTWDKVIGLAAAALSSMGYSASRATTKANQ